MTNAFLPRQLAPLVNTAVCITSPWKSCSPGSSGICGEPTSPLANTRWRGCSVRSERSARRTTAFQMPAASSYSPRTNSVLVQKLISMAQA